MLQAFTFGKCERDADAWVCGTSCRMMGYRVKCKGLDNTHMEVIKPFVVEQSVDVFEARVSLPEDFHRRRLYI